MQRPDPPAASVPWDEGTEPTYPMTPVDCLISELRDMFGMNGRAYLMKDTFEARVEQFKNEVAGEELPAGGVGADGRAAEPDRAPSDSSAVNLLGPDPIWNGKLVTVPIRRVIALWVTGILIGVAGGVAISWGLWGLNLAFH